MFGFICLEAPQKTEQLENVLDSNSQGVVSRLGDTMPSLLHQLYHYIASEEEHPYDALQSFQSREKDLYTVKPRYNDVISPDISTGDIGLV
jgi:hypothetical protein